MRRTALQAGCSQSASNIVSNVTKWLRSSKDEDMSVTDGSVMSVRADLYDQDVNLARRRPGKLNAGGLRPQGGAVE
jgi:hypothetical protein